MIDVDILEIDLKIIKNFEEHRMNISAYEDKKKNLEQ